MSLAAAAQLLATALMLLDAVNTNQSLPQSMRDQAQSVAQSAIAEAMRTISSHTQATAKALPPAVTYDATTAYARHRQQVVPLSSCGNGNDFYDGGADLDALTYSGKRSDFYITKHSDGSYTFKDLVSCRADTDTVINIEQFYFGDGVRMMDMLYPDSTETGTQSTTDLPKTRDARRISDIKQMQLALELYYNRYQRYPTGFNEKGVQPPGVLSVLVAEGYINAIPADPLYKTAYFYGSRNNSREYILSAVLEDKMHTALGTDKDGIITMDTGTFVCDDPEGVYCATN